MNALDRLYFTLKFKISDAIYSFAHDEKGDTNFVSIAIIIGIVVVLAGTFIAIANGVLGGVATSIETFFKEKLGIEIDLPGN